MKTLLYANRAETKSISVISILLLAAVGYITKLRCMHRECYIFASQNSLVICFIFYPIVKCQYLIYIYIYIYISIIKHIYIYLFCYKLAIIIRKYSVNLLSHNIIKFLSLSLFVHYYRFYLYIITFLKNIQHIFKGGNIYNN